MFYVTSKTICSYVSAALVLCACLWVNAALANEPHTRLEWAELTDSEAQMFEDPFRSLHIMQLSDLANYAKLSAEIDGGKLADSELREAQTELDQKRMSLSEQVLDVDWLLSQRWIVAERRQRAYWGGNPELEGDRVSLLGYLVPAKHLSTGEIVGYLVPVAGMCSHLAPPPPNQLIRLGGLGANDMVFGRMELVEVIGTLREDHSTQMSNVIDGFLEMKSTWLLDGTSVASVQDSGLEPPGTWVEKLLSDLPSIKY